ncbi:DUF2795 domain-containing protein [Methanolobus sp. ZRKC2]|uniref:DUF2795 domain-containing protein n=1 Tax=Methanolobus sp. ZRKC2 TaxID=3125783 RepID=UPI00324C0B7D
MRSNATAVQEALEGMDYPKMKKDILSYAKKHHASENIISDLLDIPDKEYKSSADIRQVFLESERIKEDYEKIDKDIESWKKQ